MKTFDEFQQLDEAIVTKSIHDLTEFLPDPKNFYKTLNTKMDAYGAEVINLIQSNGYKIEGRSKRQSGGIVSFYITAYKGDEARYVYINWDERKTTGGTSFTLRASLENGDIALMSDKKIKNREEFNNVLQFIKQHL